MHICIYIQIDLEEVYMLTCSVVFRKGGGQGRGGKGGWTTTDQPGYNYCSRPQPPPYTHTYTHHHLRHTHVCGASRNVCNRLCNRNRYVVGWWYLDEKSRDRKQNRER